MRIVVMADGKGTRWNNYKGTSKHLVEIKGESLLQRTIRLIKNVASEESEIIVTSHDSRYEFDGCTRYEPKNNVLEIDRFTEELIQDQMCFLYGDTYYTDYALEKILNSDISETCFYGNSKSIVGIRIQDGEEFKKHKADVREKYLLKEIETCKGWQVYQSFTDQNLNEKPVITDRFVFIDDRTSDVNTSEDYRKLVD